MNVHLTISRAAAAALVALVSTFVPTAAAGAPQRDGDDQLSAARPVPFTGTLDGVHTSRTPLTGAVVRDRFDLGGRAIMLGRFTVVIESTVDFGARPVTGFGTITFTAASGDKLVADQSGASALLVPGTVLITEHAVIDPLRSTGRFAGAEGRFTVQRTADAATGVGGRTGGSFAGTISLERPSPH